MIAQQFSLIHEILQSAGVHTPMLVCGKTVSKRLPQEYLHYLPANAVWFDGFSPNPLYEDVMHGVELFRKNRCDGLISIGGGSAIDVAKCIQLYCKMPEGVLCLEQPLADTGVFHLAIPTTAGTGSEATRFAVIYYQGVKQSICHESIIPQAVILDPVLLHTLPTYQRKATVMDALCQAIESVWSVNSTEESISYAERAISLILPNICAYIQGDNGVIADIQTGAHLAGKAINITQTTAPHAMSYKLTSLFGISHGHAVALCMKGVWAYMTEHPQLCCDPRGRAVLDCAFARLNRLFGTENGANEFALFYDALNLDTPIPTQAQMKELVRSVNSTRLKNHPIVLTETAIEDIYRSVLK